jgi:hypothetical protein
LFICDGSGGLTRYGAADSAAKSSLRKSRLTIRIEIDHWKVGARLTHYFHQHEIDPLPDAVVEWDPPRQVRLTWGTDTIGFDLTPARDGGTIFVLTERRK